MLFAALQPCCFFFQAEDGIRDLIVTGVQTCALPICMVKRLSETGLIEHVPYRGVQLTSQGRRAALRMIRRHHVLELYLTQHLGYDWGNVHAEAERLEHAVSDDLIERMANALGQPQYDPHGDPIPTAAGDIEEAELVALGEAPIGTKLDLRSEEHTSELQSRSDL